MTDESKMTDWNKQAKEGDETIIGGVKVRKVERQVPERRASRHIRADTEKALEDVPTKQIEKFLEKRREKEAVEKQYNEAVSELQQVHAFAIDAFFAKAELLNARKTGKVWDRGAFDSYAEVYKKSVDEVLEGYWVSNPTSPENVSREFPLKDEERDLRTRKDITEDHGSKYVCCEKPGCECMACNSGGLSGGYRVR